MLSIQLLFIAGRTLPAGKKVRVMTTTRIVIANLEAQKMAAKRMPKNSHGPSHTHLQSEHIRVNFRGPSQYQEIFPIATARDYRCIDDGTFQPQH